MAFETDKKRVPLYERLPEIYRIRDQEQEPSGQFKSYLGLVESAFSEIHKNIEALYHDLFIETCDPWVIPYIGDLLGVSHLKGEERTLRADVADTIAMRRRKGTLAGMERLTYNLTGWGVHCKELRENMMWNQHLNHQRPDDGGDPPYRNRPGTAVTIHTPIRGGTVTLRDPAMLSLLNTPFDPFAHVADLKPPALGNIRFNLPNLAIFLWRLKDYRIQTARPLFAGQSTVGIVENLRFHFHPMGHLLRLFNTYQFDPDREPPVVSLSDETPNPIPTERLTMDSDAGRPEKYVAVDTYNPLDLNASPLDIGDTGIQFHLPEPRFSGETWPHETAETWTIRGGNLCAWEQGIVSPLENREIIIDPVSGRFLMGVANAAEVTALGNHLLVTYTYGAPGSVGAHPVSRQALPLSVDGEIVKTIDVKYSDGAGELKDALNKLNTAGFKDSPVVIQIKDSMTYELDINQVDAALKKTVGGAVNLLLRKPLTIRAADGQRPVIKLKRPLRFRPKKVKGASASEQQSLDTLMDRLTVMLQGLYITRGENWDSDFPAPQDEPLVARTALNKMEIDNSTLDPGGHIEWDSANEKWICSPIYRSLSLEQGYEFSGAEADAFNQIPQIDINHSITGPLRIDIDHTLFIGDSVIDGGSGVGDAPQFAILGTGPSPADVWGPPMKFKGITVFGAVRVEEGCGEGGIFVHPLEVKNHQTGCIKFSYFQGIADRLPQNHGCVKGSDNHQLRFVSEIFGESAYGQLHHTTDFKIRERGPGDDTMGAYGFLLEAHKWRNLNIRFREFMPVGVRPLLIPVT